MERLAIASITNLVQAENTVDFHWLYEKIFILNATMLRIIIKDQGGDSEESFPLQYVLLFAVGL